MKHHTQKWLEPRKPDAIDKAKAKKRARQTKTGKNDNKCGRPSKYKPEYDALVEAHLSEGYSFASFAAIPGVHIDTLYEWMDKHPSFSEAVNKGRALGMAEWERILKIQALSAKGNTAAIIYAMKNLYRDHWQDRMVHEQQGANGGPIQHDHNVVVSREDLNDALEELDERL